MGMRMIIGLALFCSILECKSDSIDIQGDTLLRWPHDSIGVVVVPSNVKHIGLEAFAHCKAVTDVVLPCSLETIGPLAFSWCSELRDIHVPNSVTNIGEAAFRNCWGLTNLSLQASIREIPNDMCAHCHKLISVDLPEKVVTVGDRAFSGCRSIRSIKIPNAVSRIGRDSFAGCSRIKSVDLPKELAYIGENAFFCCYDLKHLFVHSSLDFIGLDSFRECQNLKGCVVLESTVSELGEGMSLGVIDKYVVYSVFNGDGPASGKERSAKLDWCRVGGYECARDAVSAVDGMGGDESDGGMLEGLAEALKAGADGLIEIDPHSYRVAFRLDAFAAHMCRLRESDNFDTRKRYFTRYSSTSIDTGDKLVANFDFGGKIAMEVEFKEGQISKLVLSDGLKAAIRKGLILRNGKKCDKVLKWIL